MFNLYDFLFGGKANKEISKDIIFVIIDADVNNMRQIRLDPDSSAETVVKELLSHQDLPKAFLPAHPEHFYLELTIKDAKTKINILKRRINYFENVYSINETKEADKEFVWTLKYIQIQKDMNMIPTFNTDEKSMASNIVDLPEKFERDGILYKKSKKGELKEIKMTLYKDNLVYYKTQDPSKMRNFIPLVMMKAEPTKEKHIFSIRTVDKWRFYKAKSEVDMKGWYISKTE